ncbi:hypothetical protein O6H91_06G104200 [Diphasiastrum complanatum]|uniref:Uncharacterized protein n=1 Tax=Diphasiastrum complanatum TaxID=34168 RepID=A0ACC2DHC4_DIPCM|nr:hypothetical protein O6H91_06G104200 [Diphasiastrum complanatum]
MCTMWIGFLWHSSVPQKILFSGVEGVLLSLSLDGLTETIPYCTDQNTTL